jgi:hypothetical protein
LELQRPSRIDPEVPMDILLRKLAEWKGRRRAAQVIVFDGGAEVERTRAFLKGALTGIALAFGVFLLAAPDANDAATIEALRHREALLHESDRRLQQALHVTDVCLSTADRLQETVAAYQGYLGGK